MGKLLYVVYRWIETSAYIEKCRGFYPRKYFYKKWTTHSIELAKIKE